MKFEYDAEKSASNEQKHGIDFVEAQKLWSDPNLLEAPANVSAEPRLLFIGKIGEKHWSAIGLYRDKNLRIISVRRSRKKEIEYYEDENG